MKKTVKKICTQCETPKPADTHNFYARKTAKDKLSSWCIDCDKKKHKLYAQRAAKRAVKEATRSTPTTQRRPKRRPAETAQAHA